MESAYAGRQNMVALISSVVRGRDVIAGLHLDHSPSVEKVVECIREGHTSVMFDGFHPPTGAELGAHPGRGPGGPTGRGQRRG